MSCFLIQVAYAIEKNIPVRTKLVRLVCPELEFRFNDPNYSTQEDVNSARMSRRGATNTRYRESAEKGEQILIEDDENNRDGQFRTGNESSKSQGDEEEWKEYKPNFESLRNNQNRRR